MKIIIGSDPLGISTKDAVKEYLLDSGYTVTDISGDNGIDYYNVGYLVGKAISNKEYDRGFIFCGTGMGVNIVCNKFPGVYCGLVESIKAAQLCRTINNCNVLSIGGLFNAPYKAKQMAKEFLETEFTVGFNEIDVNPEFLKASLNKIKQMEKELFKL